MARGFLSGAFWGVLVAVGGAGTLSVMSGGGDAPSRKPEAAAVEVPAGSQFNQSRDDNKADLPSSEPVVTDGSASRVTAPEPDDLSPLRDADTNPGVQPDAGDLQGGLNTPATAQASAPDVTVRNDAPVSTGAQTQVPLAPQDETELSISTEPAQPAPPPAEPEETAFGEPETQVEQEDAPPVEPDVAAAPAPQVQSDAPASPAAPAMSDAEPASPDVGSVVTAQDIEKVDVPARPEGGGEELVIRVAPESATPGETAQSAGDSDSGSEAGTGAAAGDGAAHETSEEAVEPDAETDVVAGAPDDEAPESVSVIDPVVDPVAEDTARTETEEGRGVIRIGKPARDIDSLGDSGIRTGRLPSVRAGTPADEPEVGETTQETANRSAMPPIKRFATEVQDVGNKPQMAIVLIDDSSDPVVMDMLSAFPYPLAFAVDTSREDAIDKMTIYRAAGFEVLAMVSLPEGATPSDVEVAMPVLLARVPEAVAVMEAPGPGIQSDRVISDQVTQILSDTGHGLLFYPKGLNTAQKLAAKSGVPSATIFRDFDSANQKPRAIRRFLDNGALRAGSEGGVVMVGRMRPDTVSALLLWALEDRADQIALVPVSQLLQPQD